MIKNLKYFFVYWKKDPNHSPAALYEVSKEGVFVIGEGNWASKPVRQETSFRDEEDLKNTSKVDWHNQIVEIESPVDIEKIKLFHKLTQ